MNKLKKCITAPSVLTVSFLIILAAFTAQAFAESDWPWWTPCAIIIGTVVVGIVALFLIAIGSIDDEKNS